MSNRYTNLEHHADLGVGAEEFEQTRRFTRRSEMTAPPTTSPAKNQVTEGESTIQKEK